MIEIKNEKSAEKHSFHFLNSDKIFCSIAIFEYD